jgi:hypothetical protein
LIGFAHGLHYAVPEALDATVQVGTFQDFDHEAPSVAVTGVLANRPGVEPFLAMAAASSPARERTRLTVGESHRKSRTRRP